MVKGVKGSAGTAASIVLSTEYRVPSTEYRVPSTEYRVLSTEYVLSTGYWVLRTRDFVLTLSVLHLHLAGHNSAPYRAAPPSSSSIRRS